MRVIFLWHLLSYCKSFPWKLMIGKKKPECHQVASRCVLLCWYLCFVFIKTFKLRKPYQAEMANNGLLGYELFSFPDCYFLNSCFKNCDSAGGKIHNIKYCTFKKQIIMFILQRYSHFLGWKFPLCFNMCFFNVVILKLWFNIFWNFCHLIVHWAINMFSGSLSGVW